MFCLQCSDFISPVGIIVVQWVSPVAGLLSMVVSKFARAETNGHLLVGVSGIAEDVSLGIIGVLKGSFLADAAV